MRLDSVATTAVVVAAVAVAAANVHREFFHRATVAVSTNAPPSYVRDWKDLVSAGTIVGDSTARVTIVEFADLECPGCREFHARIRELRASNTATVAVAFIHFPLPQHRFAIPAARAAECARAQGRFPAFVDLVFAKQDSLGLKAWTSYADESGVLDTATFKRCTTSTQPIPSVVAGLALGAKLGVRATPTVIINGWRFGSPPRDSLAWVVRRLSASTTLVDSVTPSEGREK